jgi:hypothetical protein
LCTQGQPDNFAWFIELLNIKYMKKFLGLLASSMIILSGCNKDNLSGSGATDTELRVVPVFTSIELKGSAEVDVSYSTTQEVKITGYENLLPYYETKVFNNTLYLQFRSDVYNVRHNNIKLNITLPLLSGIRVNGSGKVTAGNFINGDGLTASVNGSGDIFVNASRYNKANYFINGSGDLKASGNIVAEAVAGISGSGSIELNVTDKLKANISGSGDIKYWGNPGTVETQVSGSGKVTKN